MPVPSRLDGNGLCWLVPFLSLAPPRLEERSTSLSGHNIYKLAVKDSVFCGSLETKIPDMVSVSVAIPGNLCLRRWVCSALGMVRSSGFLQGVQHGGLCPETEFPFRVAP